MNFNDLKKLIETTEENINTWAIEHCRNKNDSEEIRCLKERAYNSLKIGIHVNGVVNDVRQCMIQKNEYFDSKFEPMNCTKFLVFIA